MDLKEDFEYPLPKGLFNDPDNDNLDYEAKQIVNGSETTLPEWLSFDSDRKKILGTPTSKYIYYDSIKRQFYQAFTIRIIASDIALA